jgi:hypothetical protein
MNDIPKIVSSSTLEHAGWPESRIARGDLAEEIAGLKREPGKAMIAWGGAAFSRSWELVHPCGSGGVYPNLPDPRARRLSARLPRHEPEPAHAGEGKVRPQQRLPVRSVGPPRAIPRPGRVGVRAQPRRSTLIRRRALCAGVAEMATEAVWGSGCQGVAASGAVSGAMIGCAAAREFGVRLAIAAAARTKMLQTRRARW